MIQKSSITQLARLSSRSYFFLIITRGGDMVSTFKFLRGSLSAFLILTFSIFAFGDTLRLKDGSIIKGKITKFDDGKFVVTMGEGSRKKQLSFLANEVDSIQFDSPVVEPNNNATYKEPAKQPAVVPVKAIKTDDDDVIRQNPTRSNEPMKPIEWKVKVLADNTANGWTNSGWVVRKGQRIKITGDGKISLGRGHSTNASGIADLNDDQKLLKNVATGALIAVIGDDNNDFIYVGSEREFVASRDGALFLGINEGHLEDNSGSFNVKVQIMPEDGK